MSRTRFATLAPRLSLAALFALALFGPLVRADEPKKSVEGRKETIPVEGLKGKTITVERFAPGKEGKNPVLIFLPGIDGISVEDGPVYRDYARRFARTGYEILLVDYLPATDTEKASLKDIQERVRAFYAPGAKPTPADRDFLKSQYQCWIKATRAAVALAKKGGERVGIAGFSLGGILALGTAADEDGGVSAVVNLFGAMPGDICLGLKKLPPSFHIHGDIDEIVPPRIAYQQRKMLAKKQFSVEFKMYPQVDHVFKDASPLDKLDAYNLVCKFLKEHLQGERAEGK